MRKLPISMDINITVPEQKAMTIMAFSGIFIFRNPYVNPTEKLSKLTANASSSIETICISVSSFLLVLLYQMLNARRFITIMYMEK
ncbi:hypothetical protein BJH90_07145 [Bacillus halotolerans]|nr:hypothetical protein BCV60_01095 [Bacillus halotolerans]PON01876.1 hypothetical protein BJH90_07145 [Bacillus halotolerans]